MEEITIEGTIATASTTSVYKVPGNRRVKVTKVRSSNTLANELTLSIWRKISGIDTAIWTFTLSPKDVITDTYNFILDEYDELRFTTSQTGTTWALTLTDKID